MEQSVFIMFGVLASLSTFVMFRRLIDERVMGALNTFIWLMWAFSATSVQVTSECCVVTREYMSLMIVGLALAFVSFLFLMGALTGRLPELNR